MSDPISTGLGAASLSLQLLDGVVKGYKVFLEAANMDKDCQELRTKLQIEYCRLLDWSEVTGLIDQEFEEDLPDVLRTDKFVLVATLMQIQALMDEFASLNGRYEQLKPSGDDQDEMEKGGMNVAARFVSIELRYAKKAEERKYKRGLNHLMKMTKDVKNVTTQPKRLVWVAFDAEIFKQLLRRLSEYNDWLSELLRGHHARKLEETTRKTYLELVQVRTTVEELKELFSATSLLGDHSLLANDRRESAKNEQLLRHLTKFKEISIAHDAPSDQPPAYSETSQDTRIEYHSIKYDSEASENELLPPYRVRDSCDYFPADGSKIHAWIEWKPYKRILNQKTRRSEPAPGNVNRMHELVNLLQRSNIAEFRIPQCIGYFDDRSDKEDSEHLERFGIVFQKPDQDARAPQPISLLDAFQSENCPSLTERVAMAHKLATCILYLHAVKWLHKGLRSDGVIFFPGKDTRAVDFTEPYLSGFEYARPDRDGAHSTGGGHDPLSELYVHPSYQGAEAVGTYRKTFDIYSLGVVLLEIIHWQPVQDLLKFDDKELPSPPELKAVREQLLGTKSPLTRNIGDRLYTATRSCIQGLTAFGLKEGDDELSPTVGTALQKSFTKVVVDNLKEIVV